MAKFCPNCAAALSKTSARCGVCGADLPQSACANVNNGPKLIACGACGNQIAVAAAACPKCGAPNSWLHPEIERFAASLQKVNFLPPQSKVLWKGFRVSGWALK